MGFLAGVVRKKRGLKLDSEKKNRERVYRIPASQTLLTLSRRKRNPDR